MDLQVRPVVAENTTAARRFLQAHADTSVFLLHTLEAYGPRRGSIPESGDFSIVVDDETVVAVFSCTKRGHLLAESSGRIDVAPHIAEACGRGGFEPHGVVAEWRIAQALAQQLPGFVARRSIRHQVYAIDLVGVTASPSAHVRQLTLEDFEAWEKLARALQEEEGIFDDRPLAQRETSFQRRSAVGHTWGFLEEGEIVGTLAVDAVAGGIAQIGNMVTRLDRRRRGVATSLWTTAAQHLRQRGVSRVVLFVRDDNAPARALYERLGFTKVAEFGFLFDDARLK